MDNRKNTGSALCLVAVLGILALTLTGCGEAGNDGSDYVYVPDEVTYTITGTAATVDITLNNATGGTEQYSDVPVPWEKHYDDITDWFLYVSAQNQGSSGTVTVKVYHNGNLVDSATSSGAYVIATASGSIDSNW